MKYVILADSTRIDNCTDSTTSNEIFAVRNSYEEAGAVRDLFTDENSTVIYVYDSNDQLVTKGSNLVLISGASITEQNGKFICAITTRVKTEMETIKDEITELQEAILG